TAGPISAVSKASISNPSSSHEVKGMAGYTRTFTRTTNGRVLSIPVLDGGDDGLLGLHRILDPQGKPPDHVRRYGHVHGRAPVPDGAGEGNVNPPIELVELGHLVAVHERAGSGSELALSP